MGVAVRPSTYFALARFNNASKETAERWWHSSTITCPYCSINSLVSPWRVSDCISAISIFPVGRLPSTDSAEDAFPDAQKGLQPFLPLPEQFGSMHQDQRVDAASRDQRSGRHSLAEGGWGTQHTGVMSKHRRDRVLLVRT